MSELKSTLQRLKFLPALFRKVDVEKVTPHAAVFLSRAMQKSLVYRLNRGNYVNSFLCGFPRVEEVACFLRPPAYVTCEWALNYHGISLQSPYACTAATLSTAVGRNRSVEYQGVMIEFSKISPALFFGFTRVEDYLIAAPEKAILDTLYFRKSLPVADELEIDAIDRNLLREMAAKFPSTVIKRLPSQLQQ
jgi:predicted transcriptional regulator of viral defense system